MRYQNNVIKREGCSINHIIFISTIQRTSKLEANYLLRFVIKMCNMSFRLKFQYPVEDQSLSITWGGGRFWGASGSIESKGKGGISRHQKRIKGGGDLEN